MVPVGLGALSFSSSAPDLGSVVYPRKDVVVWILSPAGLSSGKALTLSHQVGTPAMLQNGAEE